MEISEAISMATYRRMPLYLKVLRGMKEEGKETASSVSIAEATRLTPALVKKDLSYALRQYGKPKVGYDIDGLIEDLEYFLGYDNINEAVLCGVGKLGQALLGYAGFEKYGFEILAGFDVDPNLQDKEFNGKKIYGTEKIAEFVKEHNIKIGIVTTPQQYAQEATDKLVASGIRAIWNFTPAHLTIPDNVVIKNEDMASSLAVLSIKLKEILNKEND